MRAKLIILCGLLVSSSCRLNVGPDEATLVSSLRFAPSAFDSFKRNTELHYTLRAPAELRITIVRRDGSGADILIQTLAGHLRETKGTHGITWLGDTSERLFAPAGRYLGVVESGESRFEASVEVFHY